MPLSDKESKAIREGFNKEASKEREQVSVNKDERNQALELVAAALRSTDDEIVTIVNRALTADLRSKLTRKQKIRIYHLVRRNLSRN